jgi:hypothetical protein
VPESLARKIDEHRCTIGGRHVTLDTYRPATKSGDRSIETLTPPTADHHSHTCFNERLGRGKTEASGAGGDGRSAPRDCEVHGN